MNGGIPPSTRHLSPSTYYLPTYPLDSQDMEIEIDRFGITRAGTLKKYDMIAPPEGKLQDKLNLGVDAICLLCIGAGTVDASRGRQRQGSPLGT